VPGRHAGLGDWVADAAGGFLGAVVGARSAGVAGRTPKPAKVLPGR